MTEKPFPRVFLIRHGRYSFTDKTIHSVTRKDKLNGPRMDVTLVRVIYH